MPDAHIALLQIDPAPTLPGTCEVLRLEPLQLEISLAETCPWPGLVIRAAVRYGSALIRLRKLQPHGEHFILHQAELVPDSVDALIVRTLLGLPTEDGVAFRTGRDAFAALLVLIRQASPNSVVRESERVRYCRVLAVPPLLELSLRAEGTGSPLCLHASALYRDPDSLHDLGRPLHDGRGWLCFEHAVAPSAPLPDAAGLKEIFATGTSVFEGRAAWDALREIKAHARGMALRISPTDLADAHAALPPQPVLRIEPAQAGCVEAALSFEVGGACLSAEELLAAARLGEPCVRKDGVWCRVDAEIVREARQALAHLVQHGEKDAHFTAAEEEIPELLEWARKVQGDAGSPWNVYVAKAVAGANPIAEEITELRLRLDMEEDGADAWFTVAADLSGKGRPLTPEEIERLMRSRKKWLRDGARWRKLNMETLGQFQLVAKKNGWRATGPLRYSFRAEEREKVEQLFSLAGSVEYSEKYRTFVQRLQAFNGVEAIALPEGFQLPLRPYQMHGYQWLRFLARYGLNGILADDMGLGKTSQTLALLAALREELGPWPSLIVCPTSLVDNWRKEILKFTPLLKALCYTGSPEQRDRLRRRIPEHDVVLATYATVRNDANLLRREQWRYVILDEAQAIKNAAAEVTRAVKTIPSRHRLALTGTPVQNRLDELWSIFDFLMPGFLGKHAHFFREYEDPIARGRIPSALKQEQHEGERRAELLRERIQPFVLRRLKTDVAKDLPEKIEQDLYCELSGDQAALYRQFAQSAEARRAMKEMEEKGAERAQTEILAALTMLRKICNHPDLVHLAKESAAGKRLVPLKGYQERSGKLQVLGELLDQCQAGGHRALVFCQLTSMLDILEYFLMERGERWLRLDGSTPGAQRQALVDRFNAETDLSCFLISTRAGGSGLNLTGADTVIFYDHDWNPANDRQAQDRAYRIGQTRQVNVYRLVTQGTFEEKVLDRQKSKLALADSVVQHDPTGFKHLTREDLLSLFALTEK